MEETNRTHRINEEIERYRREMMALYQQQSVATQTESVAPPTTPIQPPQREEQPSSPPIAESAFIGCVRVFAFTANEAEPLQGARVTVSRAEEDGEVLYANAETDRDGFTPVIPLPTVDPALSLRPDGAQPFIPYDIRVTADGFRPVIHRNVPVYGNNYVTQPAALVPLLPGGENGGTQQFQSGGPADL